MLGDEAVVAAGQRREILVGRFEEVENRLDEVVAAGHHALHVVLLVLHRAQQDGIGEVDHLRHAPARRAEEFPLTLGRALDDVFRARRGTRGSTVIRACRRSARDAS